MKQLGSHSAVGLYQMTVWVLCSILIGCGSNANLPEFYKDLIPASGTVTVKGEPLTGAAITFYAVGNEAVRSAYGLTDEQGKFTLMTPIRGLAPERSQGAVPGQYRVMVSKYLMPDGTPLSKEISHADAELQGAKESIPRKYNDQASSVLSAEVQADPAKNEFHFEL